MKLAKNRTLEYAIIIICFLSVLFSYLISNINKREREKYSIISVAKIIDFKGSSKSQYLDFKYYYNDKIYKNDCYRGGYPNLKIGEYYKIILSSKNPENVEIFLNEKITDSLLILQAGFRKDYIKNMFR